MSFKREGDDQSILNVLKKRRVEDLLSHFIPEDEAALMKNGRYSCLVCSRRPVFDTVDMLSLHRKGKRHLEGLNWFYRKKVQLQNEIDKKRHLDYVNREDDHEGPGSSAPLLAQTRRITHHALLRTVPYSSCHKKASERSENPASGFNSDHTRRPVSDHSASQSSPVSDHSVAQSTPVSDHSVAQSTPVSDHSVVQSCTTTTNNVNAENTPVYSEITNSNHFRKRKRMKRKMISTAGNPPERPTEQKCREMEHYLKLKSAGWLHDPSGKWIKDENVEFDSDEEEPLPLLPSSDTM